MMLRLEHSGEQSQVSILNLSIDDETALRMAGPTHFGTSWKTEIAALARRESQKILDVALAVRRILGTLPARAVETSFAASASRRRRDLRQAIERPLCGPPRQACLATDCAPGVPLGA